MKLEELTEGIKQTRLLYLTDSYMTDFHATILRSCLEDRKSVYIVLDETIFHPKSGGQPTDTGAIYGSDFRVAVKKAMLVDGVAVHWGKPLEGEVKNEGITGNIEWEPRYLYMRRHTAGHLFDHCLTVLNGKPVETLNSWLGDSCYVAYNGEPPPLNVLKTAEAMENQMILRGGKVNIEEISHAELVERAPDAPNIYRIPMLERYRIVTIEECDPIPCAGTHLKDVKEIGSFSLKTVEKVSSGFRVYYDVK